MSLAITHHNLLNAAQAARVRAEQCEALAGVVKAMISPASEPPIVELARVLRSMDLCIVHRHAVEDAANFIREAGDDEGLSSDEIGSLVRALDRSIFCEF